jgi:hypothetical protein
MTRNKSKATVRPATPISWPVRWLTAGFAAVCLGFLAYPAVAQNPYARWAEELGIDLDVSYDGTRLIEAQGNRVKSTERRAPGKMYTEVNAGGMSTGIILREDLQTSYILMPSMGFYQEKPLQSGMLQTSNGLKFSKVEKVGIENINGHRSTKFKTRFVDSEGKGVGMIWVTDTGVPIKMDMIYSSSNMKGQRITMQLTELNLRAQDPAVFEPPANLKLLDMGNLGTLTNPGSASQGNDSNSTSSNGDADDRASRQQACLETAAKQAAEKKQEEDDGIGFGSIMGAITRTAKRFGLSDIAKMTSDADTTADDVAVIADELGISEEDVERCRQL